MRLKASALGLLSVIVLGLLVSFGLRRHDFLPRANEASSFALTADFIRSYIEPTLHLPARAHALGSYRRSYSLERTPNSGRDVLVGTFLYDGRAGGIEILDAPRSAVVMDGGCDVVHLRYALDARRVITLECNGVG